MKLLTYLAPSIPLALYEAIARHLAAALDVATVLRSEIRTSSPPPGEPDPFTTGEADLGFLCNPGYRWLAEARAVVLVGAAPVFADPRNGGRPRFFSDVIVRRDARGLGGVFAYNDRCSLSGYEALFAAGEQARFTRLVATGSHPASIRAVATGEADAAAIDSNVLAVELARNPAIGERIRVLTSWGPHAIQPVVARATMPVELRARIATALLAMHEHVDLAPVRVQRFAPVAPSDYGVVEP